MIFTTFGLVTDGTEWLRYNVIPVSFQIHEREVGRGFLLTCVVFTCFCFVCLFLFNYNYLYFMLKHT